MLRVIMKHAHLYFEKTLQYFCLLMFSQSPKRMLFSEIGVAATQRLIYTKMRTFHFCSNVAEHLHLANVSDYCEWGVFYCGQKLFIDIGSRLSYHIPISSFAFSRFWAWTRWGAGDAVCALCPSCKGNLRFKVEVGRSLVRFPVPCWGPWLGGPAWGHWVGEAAEWEEHGVGRGPGDRLARRVRQANLLKMIFMLIGQGFMDRKLSLHITALVLWVVSFLMSPGTPLESQLLRCWRWSGKLASLCLLPGRWGRWGRWRRSGRSWWGRCGRRSKSRGRRCRRKSMRKIWEAEGMMWSRWPCFADCFQIHSFLPLKDNYVWLCEFDFVLM